MTRPPKLSRASVRTISLTVDWNVEYDFGTGLLARIRSLLFRLATHNVDRALVHVGTVQGGVQAIADLLAVESVIAASRGEGA